MRESWVSDVKRFIGFDEEDVANLRALRPYAASAIPVVVDRFFEVLLPHEDVRTILSGGDAQLKKLRNSLTHWLKELFEGQYDIGYYAKRHRIGETHVEVGLPQHFMLAGVELVWAELEKRISDVAPPNARTQLQSLHKLLMFDLMVMLEGYREDYSQRIREFERTSMEERLTQAEHLAGIGRLAASLAHEIKNPLAGISGAIQIMRDAMPDDDRHQPVLHEVLGQINRLDDTVKDLLQYARPTPPRATTISLSAVARRVLSVLSAEPTLQGVRVKFDESPKDVVIFADDAQIEQLLINLLLNAAHASETGGVVQLRIADNMGNVKLIVKDQGKGMSANVRARAFEAFYTTKTKGTGLGLPICRRIADAHAGTIEIASEVGQGAMVTVTLPHGGLRQAERLDA